MTDGIDDWLQSRTPELSEENWQCLIISIPFLFAIVGYLVPGPTPPQNYQSAFTVLGGGIASILAIVFSVTILGMQLVAAKYTARATTLFVKQPIFKLTFSMFVAAFTLNVAVLILLPTTVGRLGNVLLYAAIGLNISALALLYYFVKESAELNTPEGILDAIRTRLKPQLYRHEVAKSLDTDSAHPLHALYGMAVTAMSNRESATAEEAVESVEEILEEVIDDLGDGDDPTDEGITELFEPPLEEYLPQIVVSAVHHDEEGVAKQAVETHTSLSEQGVHTRGEFVAKMGKNGYMEILRNVDRGKNTDPHILGVMKNWGNLIKHTAEKPAPRTTRDFLSSIEQDTGRFLSLASKNWTRDKFVQNFLSDINHVEELLLEEYSNEICGQNIDWSSKGLHGDYECRDGAEAIIKSKEAVVEITNRSLNYYWQQDVTDNHPRSFPDEWGDICATVADSGLEDYAVEWVALMIEAAHSYEAHDKDQRPYWAKKVAEIEDNTSSKVIDRAFDRVRSENRHRRIRPNHPTPYDAERSKLMDIVMSKLDSGSYLDWVDDFETAVKKL